MASVKGSRVVELSLTNRSADGFSLDDGEEGDTEYEDEEANPLEATLESDMNTPSREAKRGLNRERMAEMIRQHAFSSGCKSYKQFTAFRDTHSGMFESRRPVPRGEPTVEELELKKKDFFTRRCSGFGLKLTPL